MQRRHFVQLLGLSGLTMMMPRLSFAQSAGEAPRYFVMIRMQGGWDITLGLDPKEHSGVSDQGDMYIEYQPGDILKASQIRLAPAMKPMMKHAGQFSVVNGLITASSDNGHPANLEYMSTGNGEGKAPYLPVEIATASRSGSLGVVFQGQLNAKDRNVMTTGAASVEALKTSLSLNNFESMIHSSSSKDSFYEAQLSMLQGSDKLAALSKLLDLADLPNEKDQNVKAGKILAAAFASQTAYQGLIDLSLQGQLDTHSAHEGAHMTTQTAGWQAVSDIMQTFKATQIGSTGTSLFDRTTFMVLSEFSRTPALNASKGKDHNPLTNSVLLGGGLVRGDQTFGASHLITRKSSKSGFPMHTALPVNFATGKVATTRKEAESGDFHYISPEHVVATVAQSFGVDWSKFRSVPQSTPIIKSLIR